MIVAASSALAGVVQTGTYAEGFFAQNEPGPGQPFGRPHPDAPAELADYAFMIGSWSCQEEQRSPEGNWRPFESRMTAHYILNGYGIMNHTYQETVTSSMTYELDPETGEWTIVNLTAPAFGHTVWTGRRQGDRMVAERLAQGPQGEATVRLSFHDATPDSYAWTAEIVTPAGPQPFRRKTCRRYEPGEASASS